MVCNLYSSANIIAKIRGRLRWAGHIAGMTRGVQTRSESEKVKGRDGDHLGDNIKIDVKDTGEIIAFR
jgi:hypothetical protein